MQQITITDINGVVTATQTPTTVSWMAIAAPLLMFFLFFREIGKDRVKIIKTFSSPSAGETRRRLLKDNKKMLVYLFVGTVAGPLVLAAAIGNGAIHRVTIDRHYNQLIFEKVKRGVVLERTQTSVSDFTSAEMQYGRGSSAIILIRPDGKLVYPLGDEQLQNESNQYVVLTALREVIGHEISP